MEGGLVINVAPAGDNAGFVSATFRDPLISDAWAVTRRISPRSFVRVAVLDVRDEPQTGYPVTRRLTEPAPAESVPWAVLLADRHGLFRLLCFDLDAHGVAHPGQAAADAGWLIAQLERLGLPYVACESGPSGGRHVWLALAEPATPDLVGRLGRHVRFVCRSLDIGMLHNPATGCARPPGAPHRDGGRSTVIAGDVDALLHPSVTLDQLRALDAAALAASPHGTNVDDLPGEALAPAPETVVQLRRDGDGRRYLPGSVRPLPRRCREALAADTGAGDASVRLWHVLTGYAAARRRYSEVVALLRAGSPALEHVRSARVGSLRLPRPALAAEQLLARQWERAVEQVSTSPVQRFDDAAADSDFAQRAAAVTDAVRQLQEAADASPGRWLSGSRPAGQRLVYDALCLIALSCLQTTVDASIRRISSLTPVGRTAVADALQDLTAAGLISLAADAANGDSASWTLVIHTPSKDIRTQAAPARHPDPLLPPDPANAGPTERAALAAELGHRLTLSRHDVFLGRVTGGHPLGFRAAYLYSRIHDALGNIDQNDPQAALLAEHGLIQWTNQHWRRTDVDRRDAAAKRLAVQAALADRDARYAVERAVWAWWQAEHEWMRAPRRTPASRRPPLTQLSLVGGASWPAHPRGPDGRADYRTARRELIDKGAPAAA